MSTIWLKKERGMCFIYDEQPGTGNQCSNILAHEVRRVFGTWVGACWDILREEEALKVDLEVQDVLKFSAS